MEAKHSPLPWEARPSSNKGNGTAWRDIVSTGAAFAPCYVGEAIDANAELIVRAVNSHAELVAALRETKVWMEDCMMDRGVKGLPSRTAYDRVVAALAKAEGGAA